ncbi:putative zinc ribbon protein [Moellerella wisconsensis]|uniref:putative zinc ribbon protein n=1 Tax=Moellerella wisconsensis TaxID=158849 RepID=UPI0030766995
MMKNFPASIRLYIGLTSQLKPIDAQETAEEPLKQYQCPHCQVEFNKLLREQELENWGRWLLPLIKVTHWHCVLCQYDYMGLKQFPCCQQGIYSFSTDNS